MDLISKCKTDLQKLHNCKNKNSRAKFIKRVKKCVIDAISEICDNFLIGNLKLKNFKVKLLKKYRKYIEFLQQKKPLYKKKKIIIQNGGFLNVLIPSALFLLEKFISNVKS